MSVEENLSLASLQEVSAGPFLNKAKEARLAQTQIDALGIKTPSPEMPVESLSGGNQQKVLLGKWLAKTPRMLILDEPTRGVDVGAKTEVHRLIGDLKAQGVAVIPISSELPEVLALSDRIFVMREGDIAGELVGDEATQESVLELALPGKQPDRRPVREARARRRVNRALHQSEFGVAVLLLLTVLAVSLVNPRFWSPATSATCCWPSPR